jgi:hypothetical protein
MRIFLVLAILLFSLPAVAGGDEAVPCALKNTEFCGVWYDRQGFQMIVGGDRMIYGTDVPCAIMKEGAYEDGRPYSLIKCIEQPDPKAPYSPKEPYPVGYLLTYSERADWRMKQENGAAIKYYYYSAESSNPCFADKVEGRKLCDLSTLMESRMDFSRGPIYKVRKN